MLELHQVVETLLDDEGTTNPGTPVDQNDQTATA